MSGSCRTQSKSMMATWSQCSVVSIVQRSTPARVSRGTESPGVDRDLLVRFRSTATPTGRGGQMKVKLEVSAESLGRTSSQWPTAAAGIYIPTDWRHSCVNYIELSVWHFGEAQTLWEKHYWTFGCVLYSEILCIFERFVSDASSVHTHRVTCVCYFRKRRQSSHHWL